MKESITLKIANLLIKLYPKDKNDLFFLRSKYIDFVLKQQPRSLNNISPQYEIIATESLKKKEIKVRGNKFYIPILNLKQDFLYFNDLFRLIFTHIITRQNGILLHASSIIKDKSGYIFIGEEGAGKSTVRRLFSDLISLGDDIAIIRKVNNKFFLFGSPFYQKTNKSYPSIKIPIAGIYRLIKSDQNLLQLLKFPQNIKEIMSQSFISNFGLIEEEKRLLVQNIYHLSLTTNCFRLFFRKDKSFFKLLKSKKNKDLIQINPTTIIKKANPRVKQKLPQPIQWLPSLASWNFLEKCRIIKEVSWDFEFNRERHIKNISTTLLKKTADSSHLRLIKGLINMIKKGKIRDRWVVVLEKNNLYTIIDGNHYAIAVYKLGTEGKQRTIKLIIGRLKRNQNFEFF